MIAMMSNAEPDRFTRNYPLVLSRASRAILMRRIANASPTITWENCNVRPFDT